MNTPPGSREPLHEDDQAWLDRLRACGTQPPAAASAEDHALYRAIQAHHDKSEQELLSDAQDPDHAWQRLRFRLKKEGLLQSPATRWKLWVPLALAATVLLSVPLANLMSPHIAVLEYEPPMLRGGGSSLRVQDPRHLAQSVAKDLIKLDPQLKLHWFAGVATLDVELKPEQVELARAILLKHTKGSEQPSLNPGLNRLEFSARSASAPERTN